jgi:predicted acylesterase/phospholipase RssA
MPDPPDEEDLQRAAAITRGSDVEVGELQRLAGKLREQHVVAPIAPMLIAVAKRAIAAKSWEHAAQLKLAEILRDHQQFRYARRLLRALRDRESGRDEELIRQQLALCTYKDIELPAMLRLEGALQILTDGRELADVDVAETQGIAGAIYKRMWELSAKQSDLERARSCYERGFAIPGPDRWYPGINAAFVADQLARLAQDEEELGYGTPGAAATLRARATEIREEIVAHHPRSGEAWTAETLGEAYFGLKLFRPAHLHFRRAGKEVSHLWQRETSAMQLAALARLRDDIADSDARAALQALVHERDGALRRAGTGKVGLALSGGGYRASLFHLGVLARLAECDVLRRVEVLSCVSGGSIVGAFYYLKLRSELRAKPDADLKGIDYVRLVEQVVEDFLGCVRKNLRNRLFTNPLMDLALATPWYSRTQRTAALLNKQFYAKPALEDGASWSMSDLLITPDGEPEGFSLRYENWLREAQVPMLVLNATTLNTGHSWQFTPTWMGEPPAGGNEPVDATRRLRRIYFADGQRAPQLATAVGASACVPMLFAPVKLKRLYDGVDVELVDGGVHDNQGIASLVEQDCAVMLVSDASGLLGDQAAPKRYVATVAWRTQNVLMSRVRGAQISELDRRRRSGALRGLMVVHLKKGLSSSPRDPTHCAEPYDPDDDPLAHGPRPDYGIDERVQRALSELRTDLDRFSDHEAYSLMAAGYAMTEAELGAAMPGMFPAVGELVAQASWPFAPAREALRDPRAAHGLQPGMLMVVRRVRARRARRRWKRAVRAFVVEARVEIATGIDPAALGGAVTAELCGHWEHEGPCRWPHNSEIDAQADPPRFRTLFVAADDEAAEVRERIERALRGAMAWTVVSVTSRPVARDERALAKRLRTGPRAAS